MKIVFIFLFTAASICAQGPAINSFTSSRSQIIAGQTATLAWEAPGATSITISPGISGTGVYSNTTAPGSGSIVVSPPATAEILFDGDSLTCGVGATNSSCIPLKSGGSSSCCSYPPLVVNTLTGLGKTVLKWSNLGISGSMAQSGQGPYSQPMPPCHSATNQPAIVAEWLGSNDLAVARTPVQIATDVQNRWTTLQRAGCKVVAFTITPRMPGENRSLYFTSSNRAAANALIRSNAAALGIPVVDVAADSRIGCDACNSDPTYFQPDLSHMTDNGYRVVASLAAPVINSLLSVTYKLTASSASGSTTATVDIAVQTSITVPNVVGLTQANAPAALAAAGLILGNVSTTSSSTVPAGTIISESPTAGTQVSAGSTVSVVVSSGPIPMSAVPNVIGQPQPAATLAIQAANLVVGTVSFAWSSSVPAGAVVNEIPAAGTQLTLGSAVEFVISNGASQIGAVSVSPNSGTGMDQTFVAVYSEAAGVSALNRRLLRVATGVTSAANQCYVQADSTGIYLLDDSGTQALGPVAGSTNVSNTQCTLNALGTSLNDAGTTSTLTVSLMFSPAYLGSMNIYLYANDSFGSNTGWQQLGTYTVAPTQVAVPSVAGQTQLAATSAIQSAGLIVGTVTSASSSSVPSGSVISQSPASGVQVNLGSAVGLVVSSGPAQVAVPDLTNQTQAAANVTIQSAGLVLGTVTFAANSSVPSGNVISQSPASGIQVNLGSAVSLVVSSGPAQVAVPDVSGQAQATATATIQSAGLIVGTVTSASSSTVPVGSVISQNPASGVQVNLGSAVSLVVSSGPAQVAVPNVAGQTQAAATAVIQSAGLIVGAVTSASSSTVPVGSVISQSPASGIQVNLGSAVSLVVSSGPAQVAVPDLTNQTQAAANVTIQSAGLVLGTVTSAANSSVPSGSVISQSPAPGTAVNLGSAVALVISSGLAQLINQVGVVSVSPNSGTGMAQTFVAVYSEAAGVSALNRRLLRVATGVTSAANQCYVQADSTGIYLLDDSGTQALGPVAGSTNVSNTQCTLNALGTSLNDAGTTSTLTVSLTFSPAYLGPMNVYLYANDSFGSNTGWQQLGTYTVAPTQVAVPSVAGQTQLAATSAIQSAGLIVGTVTSASSSSVPVGSVISQNPASGTQVNLGSAVGLVVSSGPAQVAVPDVSGQTQAAATAAIQAAGLIVGTVTSTSSSTVPVGSVINQNPASGVQVNLGSAVGLVVSSGPAQVAVPNVGGQTQVAATAVIQSAGLIVGTVTSASSSTVPLGSVISQNPASGVQANLGSAVGLVVSSGPAQVAVPNVIGQTQAAATSVIQSAGLIVGGVTSASSSTVPSGSVISQSPASGVQVNLGSAVSLVVSSGPAQVAVPNVAGQTQAAATTVIQSAGLIVGTVTSASSSSVPSGSVISQSPASGIQVNLGSAVSLVVSSGPAQVAVPNVAGQTQAAATTVIQSAGLIVGAVTSASSSTVPVGSVISQNPASGIQVNLGSAVSLVVSSGPAQVAVPNVAGQTQAAATTVIQSAGLIVGAVTSASSSTVPVGSVISQNPASGTQVNLGSAIALVISGGSTVAVPNVVGQTQAAATAAIQSSSLVVGTVTSVSSGTVPAGAVISSSPAAGIQALRGSAVNLIISSGPVHPTLSSLTPASATVGTSVAVTITGVNFTSNSSVTISGTGVSASGIVFVSTARITALFTVDPAATAGNYTVLVSGSTGASNSVSFTVNPLPAPTLSQILPATVTAGTSIPIVLTGTNFAANSFLTISGTGVSVSNVVVSSSTRITATLTASSNAVLGNYMFAVSGSTGTSKTLAVAVTTSKSAPTFTSMSVNSANAGTSVSVTLTGTNFSSGTGVRLSGIGASLSNVVILSPTQITATFTFQTTTTTGVHDVYIFNTVGNSNTLPFNVN